MDKKMTYTEKFSKKKKHKEKIEAENLKIMKEFLKIEGYRIEVSERSFILFEDEEHYMNVFYLEKVIFDFINNLLYSEDIGKEIRVYFRLSLIKKYLESLERCRIIKIFYVDTKCENPFKIKFPFISYFEDNDKKQEYYHKIKELHRTKKKGKKEIKRKDCQLYEGNRLYKNFVRFYKLLSRRIDIKYYRRKNNEFCDTDIYPHIIRYKKSYLIRITDKDANTDSDMDTDTDTDTDADVVTDVDEDY